MSNYNKFQEISDVIAIVFATASVIIAGEAKAGDLALEVVAPYTTETQPKLALKWGLEALPLINELRVSAAKQVARSGSCDSVRAADLFDLRSESINHLTIKVECRNGRIFFLRQADLKGQL